MVQLDVDSEVNHVVGPVREMAQNSSSPVFIGGAPGQSPPVYVCLSVIYDIVCLDDLRN